MIHIETSNGIHLCSLCYAYTLLLLDKEINVTELDKLKVGCLFENRIVKERIPKCQKFLLREGFMKTQCPQCENDLYFFVGDVYESELSTAISQIVKCPSCQANLQLIVMRKTLPATLEDWKETGKMKFKNLKGATVTPIGRTQTECMIGSSDPFLNQERLTTATS